MSTGPTVMILAGEPSGDMHGAALIRALRCVAPRVRCLGMGGLQMMHEGFDAVWPSGGSAVVGLVEVAGHLGEFRRSFVAMQRLAEATRPDAVVAIDSPEFNMRFLKWAHARGLRTAYYIGPQVWAWRPWRARAFRRDVDRPLVILPFEPAFYARYGVEAEFVGHPLVDVVRAALPADQARVHFGLPRDARVLVVMPGSRPSEVRRLLPTFVTAAEALVQRAADLHVVLPLAPNLEPQVITQVMRRHRVPVRLIDKDVYEAMSLADVALVASGTAVLEMALLGRPTVMGYRLSPLSYAVGLAMVRVRTYALPNLIVGERVVPELVQGAFTAPRLVAEAWRLLTDGAAADVQRVAFRRMRDRLGPPGAAARAAERILALAATGRAAA